MFKAKPHWMVRLVLGSLWLAEQRRFWLVVTYAWLFLLTTFLVFLGLGGCEDLPHLPKHSWVTLPFAAVCGYYALLAFRWTIIRETMLWLAMLAYLAPLTLVVLVIGYHVSHSAAFLISIFGFCVFWPLTRWFHDTIPE